MKDKVTLPWRKVYVATWLMNPDTMLLAANLKGVLWSLEMAYWHHNGSLPKSREAVARAAQLNLDELNDAVLDHYFPVGASGRRENPALDVEIARARGVVASNVAKAERAARARHSRKESAADASSIAPSSAPSTQKLVVSSKPLGVSHQSQPKVKLRLPDNDDGRPRPLGEVIPGALARLANNKSA